MGILGIENRTENWKTAASFAPFFENETARQNLAIRLGQTLVDGEVQIELFWRGVRDQMAKDSWKKMDADKRADVRAKFAHLYNQRFPELRQAVESFPGLSTPEERNYRPSDADRKKLFNNLWHTEIDIVLETQEHLFIGEAKHESGFGSDSKHILVHQLPRQYVMATILTDYIGKSKVIVPFVVGDDPENLKSDHEQVKFMVDKQQGWLDPDNILCWEKVKKLAENPTP